jgi:dUTP pyrophosphatase
MEERMNVKLFNEKYLPEYKTKGASGADIKARGDHIIYAYQTKKIPVGVQFEIPEGFELQLRPRSGLSSKGILGQLGTIDEDFTGEVCAIIYNSTDAPLHIKDGDRVGQVVLAPIHRAEFTIVDEIKKTDRGDGGFGSTGI